MSACTSQAVGYESEKRPAVTRSPGRLLSLGRAELTLLGRNRTALYTSLFLPIAMAFAMKQAVSSMNLAGTGLSVETVLLPGTLGCVLIFAVYSTVTGAYVARREELVLKRLRTGELRDLEILTGTALPSVLLGLAQCALLAVLGSLALGTDLPTAPHLLIVGVLLGMVTVVGLAAATSAFAKSTEAAQLTVLPFTLLSLAGSGVMVPLDVFPENFAAFLEILPLSPAIELIRDGWTGAGEVKETLGQLITGLAWAGLALFAVQRWFCWEPRR
ncbi:ABC transporter permease [Streptomyces caniferus]|uniref:ABC transporter permease n=1 Tax=Streptomyces caniferus TaxID=285557 RepID=UPI002E28EE10|nr:ABC transporter permease [Streptomyces caniferus]